MKTYLLNIPNELKKFSQELDAKALLSSKTWEVINDEGNRQVFIFQTDGTLLISTNGDVIKSSWQFIPTNMSIIITAEGKTTMLRPAYIDDTIFAMKKDGTQECCFLINEHEKNICPNRTLTELNSYFTQKLSASPEYLKAQSEKLKIEQQNEIKRLEKEHNDEINQAIKDRKNKLNWKIVFSIVALIISSLLLINQEETSPLFLIWVLLWFISILSTAIFIALRAGVKEDVKKDVLKKYM